MSSIEVTLKYCVFQRTKASYHKHGNALTKYTILYINSFHSVAFIPVFLSGCSAFITSFYCQTVPLSIAYLLIVNYLMPIHVIYASL